MREGKKFTCMDWLKKALFNVQLVMGIWHKDAMSSLDWQANTQTT